MSFKKPRIKPLYLENVKIIWKNFEGRKEMYNAKGNRNFAIIIPEEDVEVLTEQGWNIKKLKKKEGFEDTPDTYIIKVKINMDSQFPPKIHTIIPDPRDNNTLVKNMLDEDSMKILDFSDIKSSDIIVRGNYYDVNGHQGFTPYLDTIYANLEMDSFDFKYRNAVDKFPEIIPVNEDSDYDPDIPPIYEEDLDVE